MNWLKEFVKIIGAIGSIFSGGQDSTTSVATTVNYGSTPMPAYNFTTTFKEVGSTDFHVPSKFLSSLGTDPTYNGVSGSLANDETTVSGETAEPEVNVTTTFPNTTETDTPVTNQTESVSTSNDTTPTGSTSNDTSPSSSTSNETTPTGSTSNDTTLTGSTSNGTSPTGSTSNETTPTGSTSNYTTPTGSTSNYTSPTGSTSNGTASSEPVPTETGPTGSTSSDITPTGSSDVPPTEKPGLSRGAVAGIVIGCLLLVVVIAAAIVFFLKNRNVPPEAQRLRV